MPLGGENLSATAQLQWSSCGNASQTLQQHIPLALTEKFENIIERWDFTRRAAAKSLWNDDGDVHKNNYAAIFYWFSQPQLLWEAFPLLHMLWQSFVCTWCVCPWCSRSLIGCQTAKSEPEHVWPDSRHPRLHWPGRGDLYKAPPHTLRKSANTSKLARRTYALHPQVRTKLAIQKNKHNHNKHAVWTSLQVPLALSACDPLIVEYENKMWYWKREHTKSVKSGLTRVNRSRQWKHLQTSASQQFAVPGCVLVGRLSSLFLAIR